MPGQISDLTGRTFGRLTVMELDGVRGGYAFWWCQCACDRKKWISVCGTKMVQGRQVSCGCYRRDKIVRQAARMKVPARRRRALAIMGGKARWKK